MCMGASLTNPFMSREPTQTLLFSIWVNAEVGRKSKQATYPNANIPLQPTSNLLPMHAPPPWCELARREFDLVWIFSFALRMRSIMRVWCACIQCSMWTGLVIATEAWMKFDLRAHGWDLHMHHLQLGCLLTSKSSFMTSLCNCRITLLAKVH